MTRNGPSLVRAFGVSISVKVISSGYNQREFQSVVFTTRDLPEDFHHRVSLGRGHSSLKSQHSSPIWRSAEEQPEPFHTRIISGASATTEPWCPVQLAVEALACCQGFGCTFIRSRPGSRAVSTQDISHRRRAQGDNEAKPFAHVCRQVASLSRQPQLVSFSLGNFSEGEVCRLFGNAAGNG
jgi:hypothetical protein